MCPLTAYLLLCCGAATVRRSISIIYVYEIKRFTVQHSFYRTNNICVWVFSKDIVKTRRRLKRCVKVVKFEPNSPQVKTKSLKRLEKQMRSMKSLKSHLCRKTTFCFFSRVSDILRPKVRTYVIKYKRNAIRSKTGTLLPRFTLQIDFHTQYRTQISKCDT